VLSALVADSAWAISGIAFPIVVRTFTIPAIDPRWGSARRIFLSKNQAGQF